jgi:hypothetical protein
VGPWAWAAWAERSRSPRRRHSERQQQHMGPAAAAAAAARLKFMAPARRSPSGQVAAVGVPITAQILYSSSASLVPGNSGRSVYLRAWGAAGRGRARQGALSGAKLGGARARERECGWARRGAAKGRPAGGAAHSSAMMAPMANMSMGAL